MSRVEGEVLTTGQAGPSVFSLLSLSRVPCVQVMYMYYLLGYRLTRQCHEKKIIDNMKRGVGARNSPEGGV